MPSTTYTVLVTIAHDHGAAPSTDLLQAMIERGLEEGVRDMGSLSAVSATAMAEDALRFPRDKQDPVYKARQLHRNLRA